MLRQPLKKSTKRCHTTKSNKHPKNRHKRKTPQISLQKRHFTNLKQQQKKENLLCNDELVINTLHQANTSYNPFIRKIVIHKPFKCALGQVLPHLELEFLDITANEDFEHLQIQQLMHNIQHRTEYKNQLNEILDKVPKALPDHPNLSYTSNGEPILLPSTIIPSHTPFNNIQQHHSTTSDSTQMGYNEYNKMPVTFVFPSMSHSNNVTNPLHYHEFNQKLLNIRSEKSNNATVKSAKDKVDRLLEQYYAIVPEEFRGEKGWWQNFARPSINASNNMITNHHGADYNDKDQYNQIDTTVALNMNKMRLISLSPIGSNYGSSSAVSISPHKIKQFQTSNGEPFSGQRGDPNNICFRSDFPIITPFDQATAALWLLDALGLIEYHAQDSFIQKPTITEVIPHVPAILPQHLLDLSIKNYDDYMKQQVNENEKSNTTDKPSFDATKLTLHTFCEDCVDINQANAVYSPAKIPPLGKNAIQPRVITHTINPTLNDSNSSENSSQSKLLQINPLQNCVGSSMGGHNVLAMAALYPNLFQSVTAIATTSQTSPHTQGIRTIQRNCITGDSKYKQGLFRSDNLPVNGLKLSRMVGMLNYRSTEEFNARFSVLPSDTMQHDVQFYLQHHGAKFIKKFNPLCYLSLSKSMDLMDLSLIHGYRHANDKTAWVESARRIGMLRQHLDNSNNDNTDSNTPSQQQIVGQFDEQQTKLLLLGIEQDELIPHGELFALAQVVGQATQTHYESISSLYGHDAFLIDTKQFSPRLATFLTPTWSHRDVLEYELSNSIISDNNANNKISPDYFKFHGITHLHRYLSDINM